MSSGSSGTRDVEKGEDGHLRNDDVASFSWRNCQVTVKDRETKQPKTILDNVSGQARAGELVALMGPSGSGKTTLLNVLAQRASGGQVSSELLVDGRQLSAETLRKLSGYVEQEDALIGSLTAKETIDIAARLSRTRVGSSAQRKRLMDDLLSSFGLTKQAHTLIGTPVRKGLSGGQKRRVSVAAQLITGPRMLFLDEPTSGLDSTASREVMAFMRRVARRYNLIVVASIHQPSTDTFNLFDQLCLLSQGKTCYFGPVAEAKQYFDTQGHQMPVQVNPAEYLLDLVSTDFAQLDDSEDNERLSHITDAWKQSLNSRTLDQSLTSSAAQLELSDRTSGKQRRTNPLTILTTLLYRGFLKSYRDVLVYGVRLAMYTGLAIMMGTVWLRLKAEQAYIQPFINAIFFGSAFMSFMAVAYVPAYLEDRAVYIKDRANGLYGPTLFLLTNFLIGLPYLFAITVVFSLIAYWLTGFQNTAEAFFTWIMWVFLDLVAAESLVVFMSSLIPNFVIALALVAFANGLWMSVGGFLIQIPLLNVFWKYVFHYIDYQAYVFQGMMVNEFQHRTYQCAPGCQCSFPTAAIGQCEIPGDSVLQAYGYALGRQGKWAGILIGIMAVYRLFAWIVLWARRT